MTNINVQSEPSRGPHARASAPMERRAPRQTPKKKVFLKLKNLFQKFCNLSASDRTDWRTMWSKRALRWRKLNTFKCEFGAIFGIYLSLSLSLFLSAHRYLYISLSLSLLTDWVEKQSDQQSPLAVRDSDHQIGRHNCGQTDECARTLRAKGGVNTPDDGTLFDEGEKVENMSKIRGKGFGLHAENVRNGRKHYKLSIPNVLIRWLVAKNVDNSLSLEISIIIHPSDQVRDWFGTEISYPDRSNPRILELFCTFC